MGIKDKKLIKTSSADTARQLRAEGLTELSMDGKYFVFINSMSNQNFSEKVNQRDLIYTNKMCI